jgi:hypothetical protein
MVDRGASLTFVRRIELMDVSSVKIVPPFGVKGAGGKMFARLAGTLSLYLESGKMLVLDPVYYIPELPFNMLSEGQLCDQPDCYSVTDNHGDRKEAWQLRLKNPKGKKESGDRGGWWPRPDTLSITCTY